MPLMRAVVVAAVAAAIAPAAADASTVKVVVEPPRNGPWGGVEYRAAAGESNQVELFSVDAETIRVIDLGATITPGVGCSAVDAHTVICSSASFAGQG